jgi:ubiquinone/menaquinone biosynthesis C-methylase UbiE
LLSDTDKQALAYEAEVVPRWADPFARLLLTSAPIDARAQVLEVMCGTACLTLPLIDRLESRGRVVALDPSNALLDVARRKAAQLLGKRVFFRHEKIERLSFTDDVFDLVVSNAGVLELEDPDLSLGECVRVTKPGGALAMTLCLRGTFLELLDLFREVLERHEHEEALERLDQHIRSYPSDNEAIARFEGLGLRDVSMTRSTFPVEYSSGRACVFSPLVAHRFLPAWTAIVGAEETPRILNEIASTIDTYFGSEPFTLTVQAACLVGRKEEYELLEEIDDPGPHPDEEPFGALLDEVEPAPFESLLAEASESGGAPFEAMLAEVAEPASPFGALLAEASGVGPLPEEVAEMEVEPGTFQRLPVKSATPEDPTAVRNMPPPPEAKLPNASDGPRPMPPPTPRPVPVSSVVAPVTPGSRASPPPIVPTVPSPAIPSPSEAARAVHAAAEMLTKSLQSAQAARPPLGRSGPRRDAPRPSRAHPLFVRKSPGTPAPAGPPEDEPASPDPEAAEENKPGSK